MHERESDVKLLHVDSSGCLSMQLLSSQDKYDIINKKHLVCNLSACFLYCFGFLQMEPVKSQVRLEGIMEEATGSLLANQTSKPPGNAAYNCLFGRFFLELLALKTQLPDVEI